MALIKCWECGEKLSDRALACPSCGAPLQHGLSDPLAGNTTASDLSRQAPIAPTPQERGDERGVPRKVMLLAVFALFMALIYFAQRPTSRPSPAYDGAGDAWAKREICEQSKEAAHYIAGYSGAPSDAARVAGRVIAERKYPALDDKVIGAIASIVAMNHGSRSPTEIAEIVGQASTCRR